MIVLCYGLYIGDVIIIWDNDGSSSQHLDLSKSIPIYSLQQNMIPFYATSQPPNPKSTWSSLVFSSPLGLWHSGPWRLDMPPRLARPPSPLAPLATYQVPGLRPWRKSTVRDVDMEGIKPTWSRWLRGGLHSSVGRSTRRPTGHDVRSKWWTGRAPGSRFWPGHISLHQKHTL